MERVYFAARYDKGTPDYINCPMSKEEYDRFYDALVSAEQVKEREWEKLDYFEGCLPIEELASRGRDTLRFGPMKPVGLRDPRTGKTPWAVVQLRCENLRADSYNLVGFQNHLKYGEQARILRLIPGLESAKFLRYGQIHRNTYINAPRILTPTLNLRDYPTYLLRRPDLRRRGIYRVHRNGHAGRLLCRFSARARWPSQSLARPPSARSFTTSRTPKPNASTPPISPSTCSSPSMRKPAAASATKRSGAASSASKPWPHSITGGQVWHRRSGSVRR